MIEQFREILCPRCGADCPAFVEIRELTVPSEVAGGVVFSHWGICAALAEPFYLGTGPLVMLLALTSSAETTVMDWGHA